MKRLLIAAILLIGASFSAYAQGEQQCWTTNDINCIKVGNARPGTSNGPLPVQIISPSTLVISGFSALQNVNLTQIASSAVNTGHGTASGSLRVELPTDGTGVVGLNAGSQIIGKVGIDQTTSGTTNAVFPLATENHVGEVGGNVIPITNTLTTSGSTITTGQSIADLATLTSAVRVSGSLGASGTSGIIQDVMFAFKDAIGSVPFDVYFFNANPTASTCTKSATFALNDADRAKVIGIAHLTDVTASNTAAIGQVGNFAKSFGVASATSIYMCAVARGSITITGNSSNTTTVTSIITVLRN